MRGFEDHEMLVDRTDRVVYSADVDARLRVQRAGVGVRVVGAEDVVAETAALSYFRPEPRRHAAAEHGRQQLKDVAVRVDERPAAHPEDEVRLVRLLRVDLHPRPVRIEDDRRRVPRLARLEVAEQRLEALLEALADL